MLIFSPLFSTTGKQASNKSRRKKKNTPHIFIIIRELVIIPCWSGLGVGGEVEEPCSSSQRKGDFRGVNNTLIFENLRVGGFKLNINIQKNEVWAGCHYTEEA